MPWGKRGSSISERISRKAPFSIHSKDVCPCSVTPGSKPCDPSVLHLPTKTAKGCSAGLGMLARAPMVGSDLFMRSPYTEALPLSRSADLPDGEWSATSLRCTDQNCRSCHDVRSVVPLMATLFRCRLRSMGKRPTGRLGVWPTSAASSLDLRHCSVLNAGESTLDQGSIKPPFLWRIGRTFHL